MSYSVIFLPAAEEDYQEILRYFEKQFDSQQAIRSFVKDLAEIQLRLEETPAIYGCSRDENLRQRGYRKFLIGRYVALFKINEQRSIVEIYRIFHGTQNYAKYL
ncbi:type II toxin-antitoxin system RelE/ParE family toxin [Gemmiger sp.]